MSDVPGLSEAFMAIIELCDALGVSKINRLPGCWTHQIDEHWWVAVNGHREMMTALAPSGTSSVAPADVPPYGAYAEFNGWPFAYFGPTGGVMGAGTIANENTFIDAIKAATERAKAVGPGAGG